MEWRSPTPSACCGCWRPAKPRRSTSLPTTCGWICSSRTRVAAVCEWKGQASYWSLDGSPAAGWSYPEPRAGYEELRDHVAFYPQLVGACFVGEERVEPNAGDFYGGWITTDVTGPFKGGPGTAGW